MLKLILSISIIAVLILCILLLSVDPEHILLSNTDTVPMPVRRDGVVFVSDGSRGSVRDASLELAKLGYHVLIGVKSKEEARSFVYDQRKGLETIVFDASDPVTLVSVVNRLRQIRRDLDRPIIGMVINLADFIEDHMAEQEYVDIEILDINYKSLVKGPIRLFQSILDAIRYKTIDDREILESSDSGLMITANASTAIASARNKFDKIVPKSALDAQGLRVVTIASDLSGVAEQLVCGSKCVMQDSFVNFIDSFRMDDTMVSNISLSTVYSTFNSLLLNDNETFSLDSNSAGSLSKADKRKSSRYLTHPSFKNVKARGTKAKKEQVYEKQMLLARFRMIQQYLERKSASLLGAGSGTPEGDDSDLSGSAQLTFTAKAIVHAVASPRPQLHYDEAAFYRHKKTKQEDAAATPLTLFVKKAVRSLAAFVKGTNDEL